MISVYFDPKPWSQAPALNHEAQLVLHISVQSEIKHFFQSSACLALNTLIGYNCKPIAAVISSVIFSLTSTQIRITFHHKSLLPPV